MLHTFYIKFSDFSTSNLRINKKTTKYFVKLTNCSYFFGGYPVWRRIFSFRGTIPRSVFIYSHSFPLSYRSPIKEVTRFARGYSPQEREEDRLVPANDEDTAGRKISRKDVSCLVGEQDKNTGGADVFVKNKPYLLVRLKSEMNQFNMAISVSLSNRCILFRSNAIRILSPVLAVEVGSTLAVMGLPAQLR
jgi:hypothetical protein